MESVQSTDPASPSCEATGGWREAPSSFGVSPAATAGWWWAIKNIQFHNEKRLHTHPLEHDDQLTEQAFMTAEALAREGRLYHRDVPEGGMQNIAQGYGNWVDKPNKCIELWMQDYNHSFPITSASFSKVGVGYCQNPSTKKVYVVANYK